MWPGTGCSPGKKDAKFKVIIIDKDQQTDLTNINTETWFTYIHSLSERVVVKYPEEKEERGHEQDSKEKVLEAAPLERRHPGPGTPEEQIGPR